MAAPGLFSDLVADAALWDAHRPDYGTLLGAVGGAAPADRAACQRSLCNIAQRTPSALAFVIQGDGDAIHVGIGLSIFPADPAHNTPYDDHMTLLNGNDINNAVPIVLPDSAFTRTGVIRCSSTAVLSGGTMHGAAPVVYRNGPHAGGAPDTDDLRVRKVMLLPPEAAERLLSLNPVGRYGLPGFYREFIEGPMTSGDAAQVATWTPVEEWWRVACTNAAGGHSPVSIDPIASPVPGNLIRLNAWVARTRNEALQRLGMGGPQLTTAAFDAGMASLRNTLNTNATDRLQFERDRMNKSFTDKYGAAAAQRMHRLCNVPDDDHLPEAHKLLAKSTSKGRDYTILNNLLQERAEASSVNLNAASAPLATTGLVDIVFRQFQPANDGATFGRGLSPFAILCLGHREAHDALAKIRRAEIAEGGTSVSLEDAATISTNDALFPSDAYIAGEKLMGWSIVADVFFGVAHVLCVNIRNFVNAVAPQLHRLALQGSETPGVAMDLVCRVMFEAQQETFFYVNALATHGGGPAPVVPTFSHIINKVTTYRAQSLSPLPALWYHLVNAPKVASEGTAQRPSSQRDSIGAASRFNTHADRDLLERFRGANHSTISGLLEGHDVSIPKHSGKPVCLTWALKGSCSSACRRASNHVRYSRDTNQALHRLLTDCGVPEQQS